jgi:hypothetical protein
MIRSASRTACTIDTRGYDFRERQAIKPRRPPLVTEIRRIDRLWNIRDLACRAYR